MGGAPRGELGKRLLDHLRRGAVPCGRQVFQPELSISTHPDGECFLALILHLLAPLRNTPRIVHIPLAPCAGYRCITVSLTVTHLVSAVQRPGPGHLPYAVAGMSIWTPEAGGCSTRRPMSRKRAD